MSKNIVIIGMPGSGKTTVGKLVSKKLNMNFIDMDEYIEQNEPLSIKEMFAISETCFRDAESKHSLALSKLNHHVIATGGGTIKRKENMMNLKSNSIIIFLNRPVENIVQDIDIHTRPLLADGIERLYQLYNERINLYKEYSDIEILNIGTIYETVKQIIEQVENKI